MIDRTSKLSVSRQAGVLGISRDSVYYQRRPVSDANLKPMHRIQCPAGFCEANTERGQAAHGASLCGRSDVAGPAGARRGQGGLVARCDADETDGCRGAHIASRTARNRRLATRFTLICCESWPSPGLGQVWAMDITYIPMVRGFIYLAAMLDWFTRRVLAWRVSITLEADFCIAAVEEALIRHGKPEIFNTDQGGQLTGAECIKVPAAPEIKISMPLGDCKQSPAGNRWQRGLAEQRLRRTPLADHQIRGGLPAGLRRRIRGPRLHRAISWLLQRPAAPLIP